MNAPALLIGYWCGLERDYPAPKRSKSFSIVTGLVDPGLDFGRRVFPERHWPEARLVHYAALS